MTIWFLENPNRLIDERKEIEQLQLNQEWLLGVEWLIKGIGIAVRVEMEAHGHIYEMEMEYPPIYPFSPPSVKPIDKEQWWTEHQYTSGTLCLEWGPDNWHSSVTGAKILESAYRLVNTENPKGNKERHERSSVPSRHLLTMGQELRKEKIRLYLNQSLLEVISNKPQDIDFQFLFENNTVILHITKIYNESKVIWENEYLPNELKGKLLGKAQVFFINCSTIKNKKQVSIEEIKALLIANGFKVEQINLDTEIDWLFLFVDTDGKIYPFISFSNEDNLYKVSALIDNENVDRRQTDLNLLKDKKVGIVGLGSLGSKLANSLARTGIENFLLIDDDVFLSGNIQRHSLDWRSVATHKIDAIQNQLKLISSSIKVDVSYMNLTGQESTSALNAVISRLGACDIIIDATADSRVFNLLSAVSTGYKKPMAWGEVFAGGIGGLIARSRPNLDPSPQIMRKALFETTQNVPVNSQENARPYELEVGSGEVWIASDIDVGVISNYLAGLVIDTLKNGDSDYPYSMYLTGLKKAWIFEEPFVTFPIQTNHLNEEKTPDEDNHSVKGVMEFIESLLKGKNGD
jgi:sulfur-carrier protein adenylyltransferase/sulfurtransferase